MSHFDKEAYDALSDDSAFFELTERQIYILGQGASYAIQPSNWLGNTSGLDLDAIIGNLEDAIANEIEPTGSNMAVEYKSVSRSSDFAITGAQSNEPVVWNVGDYLTGSPSSMVQVDHDAVYTIVVNLVVNSAAGNRLDPKIDVNGTIIAEFSNQASTRRAHCLTAIVALQAGDVVQLVCDTSGNCTIDANEIPPRMDIVGTYEL